MTSSKSNNKIVTSCHHDVNSKKLNNGIVSWENMELNKKSDYTLEEIKKIGVKLRSLISISGMNQDDVADIVFPGNAGEGPKHAMKRLLAGKRKNLKKDLVDDILNVMGLSYDDFERFEIDADTNGKTKRNNVNSCIDFDIDTLNELWPGAVEYVKIYAHAKAIGNEKMIANMRADIADDMISNAKRLSKRSLPQK